MPQTHKLFDDDAYLAHCEATVIAVNPEGIELDTTVCYARSGGQAGDTGTLTLSDGRTLELVDTVYADDRQRILHVLQTDAPPQVGERVQVAIDWDRRHRLMRLHTCLHLLGVLVPVPVTGCSISPDSARLDFDLPESTLDKADLTGRLNALIAASHAVTVDRITPEQLAAQPDLSAPQARRPRVARPRSASSTYPAWTASLAAAPMCATPPRSGRWQSPRSKRKAAPIGVSWCSSLSACSSARVGSARC